MDEGARLSEKSERIDSGESHSDLPKITFRPFDHDKDLFFLAELYWQFCHDVNGEDVSVSKEFKISDDETIRVTEAEARIYAFLHKNCQIQVGFVNNVLAAFLIYHPIFETMVSVRALFSEKWAEPHKLGKGLINSLQPKPKTLLFQTRRELAPDRCLKVTEPFRVKIAEDQNFITWHMPWRSDDDDRHMVAPTAPTNPAT